MTNVIETVARAIHADAGRQHRGHGVWDDLSGEIQDVYRSFARAALLALREPTEEMIEEAAKADDWLSSLQTCRRVYRAAIDAALQTDVGAE